MLEDRLTLVLFTLIGVLLGFLLCVVLLDLGIIDIVCGAIFWG